MNKQHTRHACPVAHFSPPAGLQAQQAQDPSPREDGRAARPQRMSGVTMFGDCRGSAFASESLSCFYGPFGFLGPGSQASFSSCGLCRHRTLNLILPSGNISLEFYNLPVFSLIVSNPTLCSHFPHILFIFLNIPSPPHPEVRLNQANLIQSALTQSTPCNKKRSLGCYL